MEAVIPSVAILEEPSALHNTPPSLASPIPDLRQAIANGVQSVFHVLQREVRETEGYIADCWGHVDSLTVNRVAYPQ